MPSLLEKIKSGTANQKEICFPGTDHKIILHVISDQDKNEAAFATDRIFQSEKVAVGFHNVGDYEAEKSTQQLYRALTDPETKGPIAPTITDFRKHITEGERAVLIEEYNQFDAECNPSPKEMPAEEFDRLICDLKKKPRETTGNISSISTLKRLVLFLASPPSNSPKGSGST